MRFFNPASLLNKLGRSHSKKSYERVQEEARLISSVQEEDDHVEKKSKKKPRSSAPKAFVNLIVGKEAKKYPVPYRYLEHPKLHELLKKYQELVFDPRFGDPIFLEGCSTETFEQVLHYIVKNQQGSSRNQN